MRFESDFNKGFYMSPNAWPIIFFALAACSSPARYLDEGTEKEPLMELEESYKPKEGYIKNAETAAKIAEAIGMSFYGKNVIEQQMPLIVKRQNNIYIVKGKFQGTSEMNGGVFEIRLSSDDGSVLGMIHGE
jgi:hypothetical protein